MPIEYEVSSLDGVEESLREAYEQGDGGKFKLNIEKYGELRAAPLHAKNRQLLDEKKQLDQKLKGSQSAEERAAELEKKLKHYELTTPLRDLLAKNRAFPEYIDLMLMELGKRFGTDDGGQLVVLDDAGNHTATKPEDFITKVYQHQRGHLFKASEVGGSGARNDSKAFTGGKTLSRNAFEALGHDERAQFISGGGTLTD